MAEQSPTQLGPWIISGIALIQVWLIALAKKLRPVKVEIYESANIEIGYSGFGPTLGLIGTLRSIHGDVFVKRISASVTKIKDSSKHKFNWHAFRSNTVSLNPNEPFRFEIASSFLLTHNNPFKYNIFLVDNSFSAEVAPKVGGVLSKWLDFKTSRLKELEEQHKDQFNVMIQNPMLDQILFNQIVSVGTLTNDYTVLERACYWDAADYRLEIIVESTKPNKIFTKQFWFSLSEEDVKNLHLNTIAILKTLCGFTEKFNFAYPEYRQR